MKKKHIVTTTALSFGLIALGGVGTTFAAADILRNLAQ
ncbi:putative membrane protein (plasmid) [Bacillus anthracis str. Vollum]|uniref:Conserved domain protein n=1 Tax=Bacillus anthracis TaxID=1392 RepID=Q9X381_BACAN|nr:pXO1-123 [Bacillus anthracis]AAM26087.1 hypothetical protein BX_A0140 [Bacillus anthracis str. A2012]AAT28881.2 conserved domain protein [Bacillus anthracis str. 'Ames Ancestor']ACP17797.1 conserved domain protein [Bacillus anthracis str. CDC 684]ACQ50989.1 conserved domain protein [Bacillus anthracis str. A0248]ADK08162.1 hypothetical protein BACI_pCIXO101270 [Bacillus cereus biovar anthracis str. CI]AFH86997.1 Hypothetical Protein H9401_5612 [Bacillus anthracis str. H9401]AHK41755.1 hyp